MDKEERQAIRARGTLLHVTIDRVPQHPLVPFIRPGRGGLISNFVQKIQHFLRGFLSLLLCSTFILRRGKWDIWGTPQPCSRDDMSRDIERRTG